jgi:hypothetical protein
MLVPLSGGRADASVRETLLCALRGRYAVSVGVPDLVDPLRQCLTRRGAAALGLTLTKIVVEQNRLLAFAPSVGQSPGPRITAEKSRRASTDRLRRFERDLSRFGVLPEPGLWEVVLEQKLAAAGPGFLGTTIRHYTETMNAKDERDAVESGRDSANERRKRVAEVSAMAQQAAERAAVIDEGQGRARIAYPEGSENDLPHRAIWEDGGWRIDWPAGDRL